MNAQGARTRHGDGDTGDTMRGVVLLLFAGVVLGGAHNVMGLRERPARGLAWRANTAPLAALVEIPAAPIAPVAEAPATPAPAAAREAGVIPELAAATPAPRHIAPTAATVSPVPATAPARDTTSTARPEAPPPLTVPESTAPRTVSLAQVDRLLHQDDVLVLDARTADEFADGHLPRARSLSYDALGGDVEPLRGLAPPSQPVLVYCGGDGCPLSRELATALCGLGYTRVLVFEGGTAEWTGAGRALEVAPRAGGSR